MKNDIIISGVGGQGILSIAATIGLSAVANNLFLKQSEVHGMSQRGGDVQSHFRLSDKPVSSDLIPFGKADLIISVEPMESLRYLPWLSKEGWIVTNSTPFINIPDYPPIEEIIAEVKKVKNHIIIDADAIAKEAGSARAGNIVILGAASLFIEIPYSSIEDAIRKLFEKKGDQIVEINLKALKAGRACGLKRQSELMIKESYRKAENFLAISSQYKLGSLVTESSHAETCNLSSLAVNNLPEAINILKELDRHTLSVLSGKINEICFLKDAVSETFKSGKNVYFCGCGATGRLSLTIETLWRQVYDSDPMKDRVFSFMSGGDVALIRSIENFEDYPLYGARQLAEAGFTDGDLLVGTTEGGETPFVIGAVEAAAKLSERKPFFLYCNPDGILCSVAERSKRVIENPGIEKINLTVGPMAVTGSTRMQSSTILLAAAGISLFFNSKSDADIKKAINELVNFWDFTDIHFIEKFIIGESGFYQNGDFLLYETDRNLGITVITDTTERSPTFSLYPFENVGESDLKISLCYLYMPDYKNSEEAWQKLLWRKPRTLEWPDIAGIASRKRLLGFDFSAKILERRTIEGKPGVQHIFSINKNKEGISFILENIKHVLATSFNEPLFEHLILKMILNIHSTLIMGRMGRYEGNVMTYVRASNNKLIDRAIRYIDLILKNSNTAASYSEICHTLFEMLEKTPSDHSIVLTTAEKIKWRQK